MIWKPVGWVEFALFVEHRKHIRDMIVPYPIPLFQQTVQFLKSNESSSTTTLLVRAIHVFEEETSQRFPAWLLLITFSRTIAVYWRLDDTCLAPRFEDILLWIELALITTNQDR
jgi:hypothetical protein